MTGTAAVATAAPAGAASAPPAVAGAASAPPADRASRALRLELAQLPDTTAIPPFEGEEQEEEDTTSVIPPTPGIKPAPSPAPFDTTGAHAPAPSIPQPGSAAPDTLRPGEALPPMPPLPRTHARADTTAAPPPAPPRHGIQALSPAAIVIGLIAVHVLIVKLIAK